MRYTIIDFFRKLRAIITSRTHEVQSQMMCPSCGLVTSRFKTFCLECGKPLNPVRLARQDAR
jgi:hypothetical protein